jgi:hypothetical protein
MESASFSAPPMKSRGAVIQFKAATASARFQSISRVIGQYETIFEANKGLFLALIASASASASVIPQLDA